MVQLRAGTVNDAAAIARLVNRAYEVERFFVEGDRTSADEIRHLMTRGVFLVGDGATGALAGSVFVETQDRRASFGMLAVDPGEQRRGWGRGLIEAAEGHARAAGCEVMEINVVNVREDLLPRYRMLGYRDAGVAPYVHRPTRRDVHFIVMTKAIV